MKITEKRKTGDYGEKLAAKYLRRNGYRIVDRNYTSAHGELDIIAKNNTHLVFCEVKTRTQSDSMEKYGRPARAVNADKRKCIRYTVRDYLRHSNSQLLPRIDIIEVYLSPDNNKDYRIEHIENAFGAQ